MNVFVLAEKSMMANISMNCSHSSTGSSKDKNSDSVNDMWLFDETPGLLAIQENRHYKNRVERFY